MWRLALVHSALQPCPSSVLTSLCLSGFSTPVPCPGCSASALGQAVSLPSYRTGFLSSFRPRLDCHHVSAPSLTCHLQGPHPSLFFSAICVLGSASGFAAFQLLASFLHPPQNPGQEPSGCAHPTRSAWCSGAWTPSFEHMHPELLPWDTPNCCIVPGLSFPTCKMGGWAVRSQIYFQKSCCVS